MNSHKLFICRYHRVLNTLPAIEGTAGFINLTCIRCVEFLGGTIGEEDDDTYGRDSYLGIAFLNQRWLMQYLVL